MKKIDSMISGAREPGVYRLTSRAAPETLRRQLEAEGWRLFHLDGREITDKASFMRASRAAMEFPGYAGQNWDAFEELVNDLSWAPAQGYVVLIDNAAAFELGQPKVWATAMDIFEESAKSWAESDTPLYVLVRGGEAILPAL